MHTHTHTPRRSFRAGLLLAAISCCLLVTAPWIESKANAQIYFPPGTPGLAPSMSPSPPPALGTTKITNFSIVQKGYIEGPKLNCTDFANSFGSLFSPYQWTKAFSFCAATKANFNETATGPKSRIQEVFSVKVSCKGSTLVKTEKTGTSPICSMGTETIGSGDIHVGSGVISQCTLGVTGGGLMASVSGSPPWHLDAGLQLVKERLCTEILVGLSASFACKADGTATLRASTWGTNFPSLYWSVTRNIAGQPPQSVSKTFPQLDMSNLWNCGSGGNMGTGTKGLIELI